MEESYITIKENGVHELEIKKSRFITKLVRIQSEKEAKEIIQATRKEHWKANHNCIAYVLGQHHDIQRSSDDGEPSGTAGVPMLEVLKKRNVINTLAIVTRYFGGIKLGAGGLIRAYSSAVAEGLDTVGLVKGTLQQELFITVDYASHNVLEHFLRQENFSIAETNFTDKVTVTLMIDEKMVAEFEKQLTNLLSGQLQVELGEKKYFEHPI
ncbi:YigZ family protein [Vagococcus elongatus]|uniref:YigZ family protein n=1 Tax=Vagococcus elongatus TaxID=180344 RepID=A0A430AZP1_9ENTE|nr:YigZ family protein [Vagococcus elongatus]RSU13472.1 YigZ family protein [Vagococcus elongatus]